jgi:DNA-binding beta-propeller fold protein YncE
MHYVEVTGWGDDTWDRDVTGVAVDSEDRVYTLRRGDDPITVLDRDGKVLDRWGNDCFSSRPHHISIGGDSAYVADDGGHRIFVFDLTGQLMETIGSGNPSPTGIDDKGQPSAGIGLEQVTGGPPFNRPTKVVPSQTGELFVSDGYRNCRVHRFSPDRRTVHSWGGPGCGEGCFVIPHSVAVDSEGRVLVCDRENDRIQVFSRDGELLDVWNDVQRPTDVVFDRHGFMYVTELARGPRDLKSWRLGPAEQEIPGRITVFSPDRAIAARISYPAVEFLAPHAIAVDSSGAIYVSEVPESFAKSTGRSLRPHRCLRKFELR